MRKYSLKPAMTASGTIYGWDWAEVSLRDVENEKSYDRLRDGSLTRIGPGVPRNQRLKAGRCSPRTELDYPGRGNLRDC